LLIGLQRRGERDIRERRGKNERCGDTAVHETSVGLRAGILHEVRANLEV
jgi:hypothetical protein